MGVNQLNEINKNTEDENGEKSQSDSSSQTESDSSDSSSIRTVSMSQKSLQVTPPVKSKGMPFIYFSQIIIFLIKKK